MKRTLPRFGLLIGCLLMLAACSVPRGAALQSEILSKSEIEQSEFAVYAVNRALISKVSKWPGTGGIRSAGWISNARGPSSSIIKAGDKLNLLIWDSDENSLLTSPGQKFVAMSEVTVAADGTIFVPYLERIYVKGLTQENARETIQTEMEAITGSAQVQLSQTSGRKNSVDLVGGVARAGSYPLPDQDFTVLSLISLGGGISNALRNPQVKLVRDGKVYTTSISRLYSHPAMDTTLRGGDKVIIENDTRYFLALGAAGNEELVYFGKDTVSALDAMSMIGGISDTRADPKGILILREYPGRAVRSDGKGPSNTRVIFTIDLTAADGLFSAGRFAIHPNDMVLVTESPVTSVKTVFSLIGRLVGIANDL